MNLKGKLLVEHNENKTQNRFEILLKFVFFYLFSNSTHSPFITFGAYFKDIFGKKKSTTSSYAFVALTGNFYMPLSLNELLQQFKPTTVIHKMCTQNHLIFDSIISFIASLIY